jgi:molybdopterin converting factor small subunit
MAVEDFDEFDDFDELDNDIDDDIIDKTPKDVAQNVASKTPAKKSRGEQISVYFQSTIGPGEKKQKLLVNTGNEVRDIKKTVGNIFGLNPADFHLSQGGVTMDDNNKLSEYPIKDGDTVLLIPASTAGKY